MAKPVLSDELWAAIEPLLPVHQPSAKGGLPRLSDRAALTGILHVLHTGIAWEYLPQEMGCGSGARADGGCPIGKPLACGSAA